MIGFSTTSKYFVSFYVRCQCYSWVYHAPLHRWECLSHSHSHMESLLFSYRHFVREDRTILCSMLYLFFWITFLLWRLFTQCYRYPFMYTLSTPMYQILQFSQVQHSWYCGICLYEISRSLYIHTNLSFVQWLVSCKWMIVKNCTCRRNRWSSDIHYIMATDLTHLHQWW